MKNKLKKRWQNTIYLYAVVSNFRTSWKSLIRMYPIGPLAPFAIFHTKREAEIYNDKRADYGIKKIKISL